MLKLLSKMQNLNWYNFIFFPTINTYCIIQCTTFFLFLMIMKVHLNANTITFVDFFLFFFFCFFPLRVCKFLLLTSQDPLVTWHVNLLNWSSDIIILGHFWCCILKFVVRVYCYITECTFYMGWTRNPFTPRSDFTMRWSDLRYASNGSGNISEVPVNVCGSIFQFSVKNS